MPYHVGSFEPDPVLVDGMHDTQPGTILPQGPCASDIQSWPPYDQPELPLELGDYFGAAAQQFSFPHLSAEDWRDRSESTPSSRARSVKSPTESSQSVPRSSSLTVESSALNELVKADL